MWLNLNTVGSLWVLLRLSRILGLLEQDSCMAANSLFLRSDARICGRMAFQLLFCNSDISLPSGFCGQRGGFLYHQVVFSGYFYLPSWLLGEGCWATLGLGLGLPLHEGTTPLVVQ